MFDINFNTVSNSFVEESAFFSCFIIFFGWVLGFVPLAYTHDLSAKENCDESVEELRGILESIDPGNTPFSLGQAKDIRRILSKLAIQKSGLLVSVKAMDDLISKSLKLFKEQHFEDSTIFLTSVTMRILELAGMDTTGNIYSEISVLDEIQLSLRSSFLRRVWVRLRPSLVKGVERTYDATIRKFRIVHN